jgi:hypothetical protein
MGDLIIYVKRRTLNAVLMDFKKLCSYKAIILPFFSVVTILDLSNHSSSPSLGGAFVDFIC